VSNESALVDALTLIGLRHTAANLDDLVALATKRRWGTTQLLEYVAETEQAERAKRSLERPVDSVLQLEFLADARNVVLVAPQGLGKTMIAQNIVHAALLAGHSALFITASQLLLDLGAQESTRALDRRLRYYSSRALLCIDEIGYLSYDTRNADLLFQVVSRRYERRSLVLTTNLAFSEWASIFPNAACTTALIDRVVHHADIIAIEGDSYRKREAQAAINKPKPSRRSKPT
jgi:DNA replication protein DnaC